MIRSFSISRVMLYQHGKCNKFFSMTRCLWNSELKDIHYYGASNSCSYSSFNHNAKLLNTQEYAQKLIKNVNSKHYLPSRSFWGWLNSIFNRVDESRILAVGPDRACAEWLLRCGAGVKWLNTDNWVKDYNSLPIAVSKLQKIEAVDATDSAVMYIGFPHFKNCKYIRKVVFHKAMYMDDEALNQLHYLRDSLKELQISSCGDISRDGLNYIKKLVNLENLVLYDLPRIKDKDEVVKDLQVALPQCNISFPYAQASEIPREKEEEK